MSDGYIKLHRQLLESSVFANTTGLKIWIWCLLKATYKKRFMSMKIGKGNTTINLDIGQFVFGRFSAEEELSIDGSTIYKWMKKFESDGMIQLQSNSHYTLVTICNWNDYQQDEEQEVTTKEQPSNNQVTTKEQPSNTNKKVKNSKESKEDNIYDDFDVDEIYQAYPTKCHIKGRSLGKTSKNKDKIKTLLKTNSKDKLLKAINFYISDCKKNNVYMQNFGTFLNNIPDIDESTFDFFTMFPNENFSDNTLKKLESKFLEFNKAHYKKLNEYNLPLSLILDLPTNELINYVDTRL